MPDSVVTVRADRIVAVGQGRPKGAGRMLDLRGRYIIPGLVDAHVHAEQPWEFEALLTLGVTTIRNPAAPLDLARGLRSPVTVLQAGPPIDAPMSQVQGAVCVSNAQEMRTEVRRQAAAQMDYIKLYNRLEPPLVREGVQEAHRLGLRVIGDLVETSWTDAARAGIDFLCHAIAPHPSLLSPKAREPYQREVRSRRVHPLFRWMELVDLEGPQMTEMIDALVEWDVVVDPTLVSLESLLFCGDPSYHREVEAGQMHLPPSHRGENEAPHLTPAFIQTLQARVRPVWRKLLRLVGLWHQRGVRLLVGSDAPRSWVLPGVSLHRELALLVAAGLTPCQALQAATSSAAAALGIAEDLGTIAPGKRADLVVLEKDPLTDIAHTTGVQRVMKSGVFA